MRFLRHPGLRSIYVFVTLLPFILSFIRDWKRYVAFGPPRALNEQQHRRRARALRERMAELGPSFIKGAQVLAMRDDVILPIYASELRKLQDRVPPFPHQQARAIVERNLGRRVAEVFTEFQSRPIAAASLGQVHLATHNGIRVAVKVLRPGVRQLVETDLRVVAILLYLMDFFIDANLMKSFQSVISEYARMIALEMDFTNEQANADRLRRNVKDKGIVIPRFISELTTSEVAVIEFFEGIRIDRVDEIRAMGINSDELIERLLHVYTRMAVVDGFVHADPHPGNLLIDREGRIIILDYGMCVEFDEFTRLELLKIVHAVTRKDVDAIVESYYRLGMVDYDVNRGVLKEAAKTLFSIQIDNDLSPKQVQEIAQQILDTFHRFPIHLPSNLVYLLRATTLLEGIALQFNPRFNSLRTASPIVKRLLAEIAFDPNKPMKDRIIDAGRQLYSFASDTVSVVHRLEREQLRIRMHETDIYEIQRFFIALLRRLLAGIALAILALITTWALRAHPAFAVSGLVLIGLLFMMVALVPIPRGRKRGANLFK
ncbi:AarF/ABC1/UbiB kinase family protein [Candidatus Sumerlaeota bacterium]|nr:AarF/ABC1/UbiB kinase family protein [Candidatus Sumerlaeota bacterium]